MKEDYEKIKVMKNDEIRIELTKLGVIIPSKINKDGLIKLYVSTRQ